MPVQEQEHQKKNLSPQEVRTILQIDNNEIVKLCRKASIVPRKDDNGKTYFSYGDVQILKNTLKSSKKSTALAQVDSQTVVNNLISNLESMEQRMTESMSKIIDDKLDGMDEVVVELIRCKTENETLRQKLNELNKENYHLKSTINSYKSVGLGLYIKKSNDDFLI